MHRERRADLSAALDAQARGDSILAYDLAMEALEAGNGDPHALQYQAVLALARSGRAGEDAASDFDYSYDTFGNFALDGCVPGCDNLWVGDGECDSAPELRDESRRERCGDNARSDARRKRPRCATRRVCLTSGIASLGLPAADSPLRAVVETLNKARAAEIATVHQVHTPPAPDGPGEGPGTYGVCCDRKRACNCSA